MAIGVAAPFELPLRQTDIIGGKWSGQQDSNLHQAIDLSRVVSDKIGLAPDVHWTTGGDASDSSARLFARAPRRDLRLGYDVIFPDLLSARGTGPLGNQFQDVWEPILTKPNEKVFHSIRHFGNNSLVDAKIMLEWRQDIMGHGGRNESEERYRDEMRLKRKLSALKKIPDLTGDLQASNIILKTTVANKISRRSRSSKSNNKSNVPT